MAHARAPKGSTGPRAAWRDSLSIHCCVLQGGACQRQPAFHSPFYRTRSPCPPTSIHINPRCPQERNANARTQFNMLMACVHVVRFLYHSESTPDPSNPRAPPYGCAPALRTAAEERSRLTPTSALRAAAVGRRMGFCRRVQTAEKWPASPFVPLSGTCR